MARQKKEIVESGEESFKADVGVEAALEPVVAESKEEDVVQKPISIPVVAPKTNAEIRKDLAKEEAKLKAALEDVKKKKAGTATVEYATVSHMELIKRNRELKKNRKPSQRAEIAKIMRTLMKTPGSNPHNPIIIGKGK